MTDIVIACGPATVSGALRLFRRTDGRGVLLAVIAENAAQVDDLYGVIGEACTPRAWGDDRRQEFTLDHSRPVALHSISIPPVSVEALRQALTVALAENKRLRAELYDARRA